MDCLQNVKSIAPLLSLVHKSLASKSAFRSTSSHSGFVASFCYKAIKRGDKEDLQHLISQGLIPLLAILQDNFTCVTYALYNLILSVPEKVDLSCFNKELYDSLLYQYWNPCSCCENGKTHSEEKLEQAYVIVALGISCNCTKEKKFISLNDYFYNEFQEFQTKVDFTKPHPSSFLLKKMAKVNCFKSSVLPYIWFLANVGSNKIVQDLHHSLPKSDGQKKKGSIREMREQLCVYVMIEIKAVVDCSSGFTVKDLQRLTNFLTTIQCLEQDDSVISQLEDLVSSCLDLLESQSDKKIVANVKKFINNLHYS